MLREGEAIGAITPGRREVQPFSEKQIALLRTFDQAVTAIGNVRLSDQVRQRTRALTEALQQQTATSDVLRVISRSSGDLQPVFKIMLNNALRICEASYGNVLLFNAGEFEVAELDNTPPAFGELFKNGRLVPPPATAPAKSLTPNGLSIFPDLLAESGGVEQTPLRVVTIRLCGLAPCSPYPCSRRAISLAPSSFIARKYAPLPENRLFLSRIPPTRQ